MGTPADPCAGESMEGGATSDWTACTAATFLAPNCKCNKEYKSVLAVANNGRSDVNKDECKNLQKLFDCVEKDWENCKGLEPGAATYDKSDFKVQDDACSELLVSPASSSRASFLFAIGAVGAAALLM